MRGDTIRRAVGLVALLVLAACGVAVNAPAEFAQAFLAPDAPRASWSGPTAAPHPTLAARRATLVPRSTPRQMAPLATSTALPCRLDARFDALRRALPIPTGTCTEAWRTDAGTGNRVQRTTSGLFFSPPAGDWTAFTDGVTTWLDGPCGLQSRPNGARLGWEQSGACDASTPVPSSAAVIPDLRARVRCGVLYEHEVPSASALEAQLVGLGTRGYRFVSLEALVEAMAGGQALPPRCLALTFDDGLMSQVENAASVLRRHAIPATFFVMPGFADGVHRYMQSGEIRALADLGFEIGSHTVHHANLPRLRIENLGAFEAEIHDSRSLLEAITGRPVRFFAYPDGAVDDATVLEVEDSGYWLAFGTSPGTREQPDARLLLPRIRAESWETADQVLERITQAGG